MIVNLFCLGIFIISISDGTGQGRATAKGKGQTDKTQGNGEINTQSAQAGTITEGTGQYGSQHIAGQKGQTLCFGHVN